MSPNKQLRIMRNSVRVLAVAGVALQQVVYGVGAAAGVILALVILAAFICREKDPQ